MRVTLKWTSQIWLTDLSLGNQHYHAKPIRRLRSWMNGFFKIMGFANKRFLSSLPLPLLALFCTCPNFHMFKKRKMLQTCGKPYTQKCLLHRLVPGGGGGKQLPIHSLKWNPNDVLTTCKAICEVLVSGYTSYACADVACSNGTRTLKGKKLWRPKAADSVLSLCLGNRRIDRILFFYHVFVHFASY